MQNFIEYIILISTLFLLELIYFRIANHFNIIDKPNERSSHTKITLRGGGIIFYIGVFLYFFLNGFPYPWFFIGLTLISMISFIDDIRPLSAKIRLVIHFIALLFLFNQLELFHFDWWYIVIALILCVGIINAYNFMDGINGITGGYSLVLILGLLYVNLQIVHFVSNSLLLYILCSILVFNFFNFRKKAKCFAGDIGSVSIAFILLFVLGKLVIQTNDLSYLIFLVVYGIDSVFTIIHRLLLKENISEPHRKHAYQIMANELKISHLIVSFIYMALQAVIILGYFALFEYRWIYFISVSIVLGVTYILFMKRYFHLHLTK